MAITRRTALTGAASFAATTLVSPLLRQALAETAGDGKKVGMCDWSLGKQDPSAFELAREIGLDGLQVSLGTLANKHWLREESARKKYEEATGKTGLSIASLAVVTLNDVGLMNEPRAAIWVADAIEVARLMKVKVILLAFFARGELKGDSPDDMRRTIEVLQELAPKAEKAGVVLGLETYLNMEDHLRILDAVKSPAVQVYYDFYNSHITKGYDFKRELPMLGKDRLCEVHFKEGADFLGSGKIDWPAAVGVLRDIGYQGWYILETSSPTGDLIADTRKNLAHLRGLLR